MTGNGVRSRPRLGKETGQDLKAAMMLRTTLTVCLIVAIAGVSGCGRRAALERPSDVRYEQEREAAKKAGQPQPEKPSPDVPDRPFILDGLID